MNENNKSDVEALLHFVSIHLYQIIIFVTFMKFGSEIQSRKEMEEGNENSESIRILLVGDSGVGKTALLHLICHKKTLSSPSPTIGCQLEVKVLLNKFLGYLV